MLGIRAYDTRQDVTKNNQRLLDYVQNGGTLLVQYNTVSGRLQRRSLHAVPGGPQPRSRDRGRGTGHDSRAAESRCFIIPTRSPRMTLTAGCRSAVCTSWTGGTRTTRRCWPANDPGEQPQKGGLLLAQYGKGYYIYNGYAFFRQLPFGVPGAIRLYVNLLSVGHEPK